MGKITRQELADALRMELDDVKNYIDGSNNVAYEGHMNNLNNPHGVTKAQIGLSQVENQKNANFYDLENHMLDRNNPHDVTAIQIGAAPLARAINTTSGVAGGGTLFGDLTLRLDFNLLDLRYTKADGTASNSAKLNGHTEDAFMKHGQTYLRMANDDGIVYDDLDQPGEFYFKIDAVNKRAYHAGNIKHGTGNPSGGKNGDIYIQY